MAKIQKVTDPAKRVTDPLVLKRLTEQGIDKDYVEFFQDYAPRSLGKEHSPYAKFYRDLKSKKRFMVVSGLPMVKPNGQKIEVGWLRKGNRFESKANLFSAIVEGKQVKLTCLSDQPDGTKRDEQVVYRPQFFVDGSEIINGEQPSLLPVDPINENYRKNVLEWGYGSVCKRRIRIIEGRFRERWLFESNPHSSIRIKHNFVGSLKLKLGYALDAEGNPLQVSVIGDEEIVEASEFDKAVYPVEIGAVLTFYPDADEEDTSVDGWAGDYSAAGVTWHTLVIGPGWNSQDNVAAGNAASWYTRPTANTFGAIRRSIFLFDTSSLPDDATITAVTESLFGQGKVDPRSNTPNVNIYSSNPASNTAIVAGDYDSLGATAYCDTPITYAGWDVADYNDFAFNATGIAAISKTGVSKTGSRNVNYDVADTQPTWGAALEWTSISCYYAEEGAGYKTKLVVTYTPAVVPPIVTTQAVNNISTTTATGNGNITDTGGENCSKRGVCWNTTGNPTVADSKSEETDSFGTGAFTRPMTGLTPGQHYYVKAYAYNSAVY